MMIEIVQMPLSYYLHKLWKDYFLNHNGRNENSQRLWCNYIIGCSLTRYMSAVTVLFLDSIHS